MIGSDLVGFFCKKYEVTPITRKNYRELVGRGFDVVINANGNSKRHWANQNPGEDFILSTASVVKSIFDFPCGLYIYLSTPDVYHNHTHPRFAREGAQILPEKLEAYGLNKYLAELAISKYKERFLTLRISMVLGSNLKKGPVFDVIHNRSLFITRDSKIQMITSFALAEIIESLLHSSVTNQVVNVGGIGALSFLNIERFFNKKIAISAEAKTQRYEMSVEKLKQWYSHLKSSEQYLNDYLTG